MWYIRITSAQNVDGRNSQAPLICALLVTLIVISLAGCSSKPKEAEAEPLVQVQAVTVQRAPIQRTIVADAVLAPLHQAVIIPKITAPVARFYVNRGDRVHKGELLATLENRDLSAAVQENRGAYEQAEAAYQTSTQATVPQDVQKAQLDYQDSKQALDAAQHQYEARQNLYKQGALARKDLDQAATAYVQARSAFEVAQKKLQSLQTVQQQEIKAAQGQLVSAQGKYQGAEAQLSYSQIRSPIDGVVTDRPLFPGELASNTAPLITVMDSSRVIAKAHIPQSEAALLKPGDPAAITPPGGEDVKAKVSLVSPALDPNSTTVEVWVQAPNPKSELRPGSSVRTTMVAQTVRDALVIPASALLTAADGSTSVMVIQPGEKGGTVAKQRPVDVGIKQNDIVQITKGLQPGDKVVTVGAYGLADNTPVTTEGAKEAASGAEKDQKAGDKDDEK